MKIVTFPMKNGDPPKRVLDFLRERDTFRNKIMEIVEDFDEKSTTTTVNPGSRISSNFIVHHFSSRFFFSSFLSFFIFSIFLIFFKFFSSFLSFFHCFHFFHFSFFHSFSFLSFFHFVHFLFFFFIFLLLVFLLFFIFLLFSFLCSFSLLGCTKSDFLFASIASRFLVTVQKNIFLSRLGGVPLWAPPFPFFPFVCIFPFLKHYSFSFFFFSRKCFSFSCFLYVFQTCFIAGISIRV